MTPEDIKYWLGANEAPPIWEAAYSPTPQADADSERFRWLCQHPDWHFIERLCQGFVAESGADFYRQLSAAIDQRRAALKGDPRE